MAYIEWNDKYLVNIPAFDEAHLGLFNLVNELYELHHAQDENPKKLLQTFHSFLEYTYSHFSNEESFLSEIEYPQIDAHKKLHKNIKDIFEKHFESHKKGTLDMDEFLEFTKSWLQNHIINEDQQYSSFAK